MANIWSTETWAILIAACALIIIGVLTGNWFLACAVTLGSYIAWLYRRLLKLEHWIRQGTKASQVYDDSGFVGIIIRQLYQQKKAQNKSKRRTKRLLRRLHQNISALPDATVLLDGNLQIEWCNEPARYLLNLRSPQDLGYKLGNLIRDPELATYLNDPDSREYIEIVSPIDPAVVLQIKIAAFAGNQFLLIARNVSDQKKFQESLKNFVANASHELKSPLTVIAGHLEMLEKEDNLSESGQRSLEIAARQTKRMKELIEGLLLLSQVEGRRLDLGEGENISITELMVNVMAALEKYDNQDRIELEHPSGLYLLGVNTEIESICINLIENAIKYTTPGTPIKVRWEVSPSGEYIFGVEDQGPGIEADEIPRITKRYYRGARSRVEATGSGLGLAIVKHAVNKHGATFRIESEPGRGSCFRVFFPSYRCQQEARKSARIIKLSNY